MAYIEKAPLLDPRDKLLAADGEPDPIELAKLKQAWDDSKLAQLEAQKQYQELWNRTPAGRSFARLIKYGVRPILGLALAIWLLAFCAIGYVVSQEIDGPYKGPVKLEAHIMSKCPDARDCLSDLILPTMMKAQHNVNFTLSYIGTPTEGDDGVACKHGAEECLGNILELCAAELYPEPRIYLGFTMCLTRQYHDIPQEALVRDCALEHGVNFDRLNACASDERKGLALLKKSAERSASANVTTSCTVRLDEKVFCVRDDGEWKDCPGGSRPKDLLSEIYRLRHGESSI